MFPFLPFVSLSRCVKCGDKSNQQKLKSDSKWRRTVFAVHNENHAGTSKEYYVTSSYNIPSSKCKIEYLYEVLSDPKPMSLVKNNKFHQKISKNSCLKVSQKILNIDDIKLQEICNNNIDKETNLEEDEISDQNFSPFVSKGRIRESFERSQIDEFDAESLQSDGELSNLSSVNQQNNIFKDVNLTRDFTTVTNVIENDNLALKQEIVFPSINTQNTEIINNNNNQIQEFNSLVNSNSLSSINLEFDDDKKQQSIVTNRLNSSTELITENKHLPLIENNTESQNVILSPLSSQSNSLKLSKTPPLLTINTPPAIRATKVRQNAFQPSQAMLELFGNAKQGKENDKKIFNNKEKFCSEPGPELIESDFSESEEIVLTPKNSSPNLKKKLKLKRTRAKNVNGINGLESGNNIILTADETNFVLTKMQLSNPGPELASENDEIEDEHLEIEIKIEETTLTLNKNDTINQEKKICSALNGHLTEEEKLKFLKSTIATTMCNANNNNLCIINETTNIITINTNEETNNDKEKYIEETKLETNEKSKKIKQNNYKQKEKLIRNNEEDEYDIFGRKKVSLINILKSKNNENNIITSSQKKKESEKNNITRINEHYNKFGMPASTNNSLVTTTLKNNTNIFNLTTTKEALEIEAEPNILYTSNVKANEQNNIIISSIVTPACENFVCEFSQISTDLQQKSKIDNNFVKKVDSETLIKGCIIKNTECSSNNYNNKNNSLNLSAISNKDQNLNSAKKTNLAFNGNTNKSQITSGDNIISKESGGSKMINTNEKNNSSSASGGGGCDFDSSILIKNVNIINDDEIFAADIYIQNGVITKISKSINASEKETEIIDAAGRWLLPAGIDIETHFSSSYSSTNNSFENGTKAALAGGTTTIIDVVVPKVNESLAASVDRVRRFADLHSKCYYGLSVIVKGEWNDQIKGQMTELVREKGVNSFFIQLTFEASIFEAFEHAKHLGAYCRIVPENRELAILLEKRQRANHATINKLEADCINRYCLISDLTNTPFSVLLLHSSENINDAINSGKKNGAFVTAELSLNSILNQNNNSVVKSSTEYALDLLADNGLCSCASGEQASKSQLENFAIQHRLALLWEQGVLKSARFDPMRFVAVTSTNAAKIFNLYPQKGRIAVGSDADVVLWDFEKLQSVNNEILHGTPLITICGGKILYQNEKYCSRKIKIDEKVKNSSKENSLFLTLVPNSRYLFSAVQLKEKNFNLSQLTIGSRSATENQSNAEINANDSRRTSITNSITSTELSAIYECQSPNIPQNNINEANSNRPITVGSRNRNVQSTNAPNRSTKKVTQPPGGKSTGFW